MATEVELKISEEVAATTIIADEYTPANGTTVHVQSFHADGAYTPNAVIRLVWDYGGTEEVVWTIKGNSEMPFLHRITETDGTKKIALVADNAHTGSLYLSGYVLLVIK